MEKKRMLMLWGVIFILLMPLAGQTNENADKTLSPYFFIKNGDPSVDQLPLKKTDVKVNVCGVIAEVTVRQTYTNEGKKPIHAAYVFPASTRAAVHAMKMIIGDKVIQAKIKKREVAKKEFIKAKKEGKSASLLEQQRPNVFTMNVSNIMPGDVIDVELSYTEFLVPEENIYEFVFPTVVGPRYSNTPEKEATEYDQWVKNPYFKKEETEDGSDEGNSGGDKMVFDIFTTVSAGIPIQDITCTSHQTDITWENKHLAKVILKETEKHGANRDHILRYRLAGEGVLSGLSLYEGKDENFFMMMIQPPERVTPEHIPPREYVFVVDVSGSMSGFPLNVSKKLLRKLIRNLRPSDTFNVMLFAGTSSLMSETSIPATGENMNRAITFINKRQGGGGTELLQAVKRATSLPHGEKFSRNIVIVTDGYVSFEESVFTHIRQNLNRSNVFAFGIGSSVNRYLIEGIAKAGYGEKFMITSQKEADPIAEKFRRYIQSPVLTHISLKTKGFEVYDVEPESFMDCFAKQPVVVFGKWRGKPQGSIGISGLSGNGEYTKTFDVSGIKSEDSNRSIRYLWARTRIQNLSDLRFAAANEEVKNEVTSLGLTYNLLTKYTSFIAVYEKIRNTSGEGKDVKQPLPLPKGVSNSAVGGGISKTPEPSLATGLILLWILLIYGIKFRNRIF